MKAPQPGMTIDDRYILEEAIGENYGAFRFQGKDLKLGTKVALSVLKDAVFVQEVRAQNLLRLQRSRAFVHPNVATISDVVVKPDFAYVVTDWVEGEPLASYVSREGTIGSGETLSLLEGVNEALVWIHQIAQCGGLNPRNLYLADGKLVVTEPYRIRAEGEDSDEGTPYRAPEQFEANPSEDGASDIFAVAMIAGFMLLGKTPEPGVALSKQDGPSSPPIDAAFVVATQANPTLRPATLKPLLTALRAASQEDGLGGDSKAEEKPDTDATELEPPSDEQGLLDFVAPENLVEQDPLERPSVDERLLQAPSARPRRSPTRLQHETIDLDLDDDVVVTVVEEQGDDSVESELEITDEMVEAEPIELDVKSAAEDVPAVEQVPSLPGGSAGEKGEAPIERPPESTETDQFSMVSDQAIFGDESLPSGTAARDEYDDLGELGRDETVSGGAGSSLSPETQAFERPDVVKHRADSEGSSGGRTAMVALLLLTVVVGALVILKPFGNEPPKQEGNQSEKSIVTNADEASVSGADSGSVHNAKDTESAPPTDATFGVVRPDAGNGESEDGTSTTENTVDANAKLGEEGRDVPAIPAADTLPARVPVEPTDAATPADTLSTAGVLEPATKREQFTCKGGNMSLITKRGTVTGPDGASIKAITNAYCVDRYEYPGKGAVPQTNVSLAQAKQGCAARGRRLCTAKEWRGACGSTYPYGKTFEAGRCNAVEELGSSRPIAPAGSFARCKGGWGTYDMVGNVAEWSSGGSIHGGSFQIDGEAANCNRKRKRFGPSPKVGYRCCSDAIRKDK